MPQTTSSAGKVLPVGGLTASEMDGVALDGAGSWPESREKKLSRIRLLILANVAIMLRFAGLAWGAGAGRVPGFGGYLTDVPGVGEMATFMPVLSTHQGLEGTSINRIRPPRTFGL